MSPLDLDAMQRPSQSCEFSHTCTIGGVKYPLQAEIDLRCTRYLQYKSKQWRD